MNSKKRPASALLGSMAVLGPAGCGILPYSITRDYSDFEEFRLDQEEYLGLCVDLDSVYSATIRRQSDDGYTVQLNIVTEINYDIPNCPVDTTPNHDFPSFACPTLNALAERPMSAAEAEQMKSLFSRVRFSSDGIFTPCAFSICDPCSLTLLTWDGRPQRDVVDYEYQADVQDFLESLRPE